MGAHVVYYCASKSLSPPRSPVLCTPAGPSSPVPYLTIWGQDRAQEDYTKSCNTGQIYRIRDRTKFIIVIFILKKIEVYKSRGSLTALTDRLSITSAK